MQGLKRKDLNNSRMKLGINGGYFGVTDKLEKSNHTSIQAIK
jgi:hypothetical protein